MKLKSFALIGVALRIFPRELNPRLQPLPEVPNPGSGTNVPEPATFLLVGLGSIGFLTRKKNNGYRFLLHRKGDPFKDPPFYSRGGF